jgi:hypothetical protein
MAAPRRHKFAQPSQAGVLIIIALVLEFFFPDGQPQQRGRAAMAGDQAKDQRGLIVMVQIGPVHRYQDILAPGDLLRHPAGETVPYVDAVVAEQPIHLLDCVLGHQTPGLGQRMADHRHRQRRRRHHAKRRASQRIDSFGVQVRPIQLADKRSNVAKTPAGLIRLLHLAAPTRLQVERLQRPVESRL